MKATALIERYRFALEVIANGPEWDPPTKTARMALLPPDVAMNPRVAYVPEATPAPAPGLSVVCEDGLHAICGGCECECHDKADTQWPDAPSEPAPDLEREPTSQPELDDDKPVELPQRRSIEKAGDDGLTDTQRTILAYVRDRGEASRSMIMRDVDTATSDRTKRALNVLCHRGLIVGEGATSTRTYKPVVEAEVPREEPVVPDPGPVALKVEPKPPVEDLARDVNEAKRNGGGTDEGRLLEAVKFRPKWTIEQHAVRLDMPQDRVALALRKLEEEGEVQTFARGGRVAWVLR